MCFGARGKEVLKSVNALNTTEVHTVLKAQRNLMVLLKKPGLGGTDRGGAHHLCQLQLSLHVSEFSISVFN
jgi:hypothetical protein